MQIATAQHIFEFAGMPKSGKTTVCDIVGHYLRRTGIATSHFHGGGRSAPITKEHLADLNTFLAAGIVAGIVEWRCRPPVAAYDVLMMDRGLVDRYIFTRLLAARNQVSLADCDAVTRFLLQANLCASVDAVFIFVTTPELSLKHEYSNTLVAAPGRVMNQSWLAQTRTVCEEAAEAMDRVFRLVRLIDTSTFEGDPRALAASVAKTIDDRLGRPPQWE